MKPPRVRRAAAGRLTPPGRAGPVAPLHHAGEDRPAAPHVRAILAAAVLLASVNALPQAAGIPLANAGTEADTDKAPTASAVGDSAAAPGRDAGRKIYVAPGGNDANPGTAEEPLHTIAAAARRLQPGDTCILRGGSYRQAVSLKGLAGRPGRPITFRAEAGERAVLDGTVPVCGKWTRGGDGIWTTRLDRDIWQLFAGPKMLTPARWPNATMTDPNFWNQKVTFRKMAPQSTFGRVVDERPPGDDKDTRTLPDKGAALGIYLADGANTQSLAGTGVNFTGAIAVMNMGSWMTWAQYVQKHQAGSNSFTYSTDFSGQSSNPRWGREVRRWCGNASFWNAKNTRGGQGYYFLEGLPCLDSPGEWWYDHRRKTLYLMPPEAATPEGMDLRGKVLTYVLDVANCSWLAFDGIDFFGATFHLAGCDHVTIRNARLLYPSFNRRVLGELGPVPCTTLEAPRKRTSPTDNVIRNCRFEYVDGSALVLQNERGDLVDNCLFHDVDYSCIGGAVTISIRGPGNTIRRCTIYNTGASECIAGGRAAHVQYCHFYNVGKFQHDGGAVQFGSFQEPVEVDHNWSHNHPKNGYRFDAASGSARPACRLGTIHHNVTWQTRGMVVKGDRHFIHNNTVWRTLKGLVILHDLRMNGINTRTVTLNNIAGRLQGRWWGKAPRPVPGIAAGNLVIDAAEVLRDPANWDFRPRADAASVIDTGTVRQGRGYKYFRGIEHVGRAPDIGAYEFGAKRYWIPGFQYPRASTPVPPDGARNVRRDADLMFLEGYRAERHVVYFGTSPANLRRMAELTGTNIFTPPGLQAGRTYYWRVDAVRQGRAIRGRVWHFTVR
ncbi:MAG: right-handed parallel beta-helix repeat-containing protein [Planctomycetes bacterium]|nr:right-handed parallel beta-helix repeat-containing protein [Planctomycetota bacterium]